MEWKLKLAISLAVAFDVIIVLLPLVEFMLCAEPELGIFDQMLVNIGAVQPRNVCPVLAYTILEVLKNMASLVAHCFLGYYIRKIQAKMDREKERMARIRRMERMFEELDGPVPPGFIPGVTVRHIF